MKKMKKRKKIYVVYDCVNLKSVLAFTDKKYAIIHMNKVFNKDSFLHTESNNDAILYDKGGSFWCEVFEVTLVEE